MASGPRLGTRGSALALAQAGWVADALGGAELVRIETADAGPGDKYRFVREIDRALLAGEVDLAVHSAKDVPAQLAEGLEIAAVPARETAADAFVGQAGSLDEVPAGARIGTSSLRRRAQLLARRPDLEIVELRGNVDTRLRRLAEGEMDGLVLALAGLRRLGREGEAAFVLDEETMIPAAGQGALALTVREGDESARAVAASIASPDALAELTAERTAVAALDATCHTPVGVRARVEADSMTVSGFAGLPDGSEWIRDRLEGDSRDPAGLGQELAARMVSAGAEELLARVL